MERDELGIPYARGGSLASSLVGEPRSTVVVDIAIKLEYEADERIDDTWRGRHAFALAGSSSPITWIR